MVALEILNFMKVVEQLSLVYRDNKLSNGDKESDADHCFKLCFLIMMITPYLTKHKPNVLKMMQMAIVHDLAESFTGDISLCKQTQEVLIKKAQKELEAINKCKEILPSPLNSQIYDLFIEYEARSSVEAKIVYVLDKIEAHLQANQYNNGDVRYWGEIEGGSMYYDMMSNRTRTKEAPYLQELDEDILIDMELAIKEISCKNMKKYNIS